MVVSWTEGTWVCNCCNAHICSNIISVIYEQLEPLVCFSCKCSALFTWHQGSKNWRTCIEEGYSCQCKHESNTGSYICFEVLLAVCDGNACKEYIAMSALPIWPFLQESLEDISYLLRIPQRKPYGTMEGDVKKAIKVMSYRASGNYSYTQMSLTCTNLEIYAAVSYEHINLIS